MKKLLLVLGLGSVILFTGCDKDNGKDGGEEVTEPLTAEENKQLMQQIGVDFVDEMSAMQQEDGVKALTSFGLHADLYEDDEEGRVDNSSAIKIAKAILGFTYQKASVVEFGYAATRISQDDEDDFTSLQELFDDNTGTYSWNFDTEEYDFEDNSSDKVIFEFPSEVDGTTNDATLTLSNYSSVTIGNPLDEDYDGDLPTSLDVSLEVGGSSSMTYGFEIDYNNEGVPETIDTEMTLGTFSLTVGLTNTSSKVGANVSFNNGSKVLIATATEINGDFSDSAIDAAEESEDPTEVVTDGTFSFTLMDLKFDSEIDFASLWNEVGDLELYYEPCCDDSRPDLDGNAATLEEALNEFSTLKATYISTSKKAADVEFYTFIEVDDDYGDESVELGARMVFEDESKVDVKDFLETGFDGLETAINDLIKQINTDLDQDDWIEEIDFSDLG